MIARRTFLYAISSFLAANTSTSLHAAPAAIESWAQRLLAAAEAQVGVTTLYSAAYVRMPYPDGDVPRDRGVCTDVVIRAYRDAFGRDLQKLVHEDMSADFAAYPRNWGLSRPDSNIDHRRVGNLQVFFRRHGRELPLAKSAEDYAPGDLYTCLLPGNLPHIGLVSGRKTPEAERPLIINNIGQGTKIEDRLFEFPLTGHYRFVPRNL
jgi:uncharacterized protein YijF (DUF1287 family)